MEKHQPVIFEVRIKEYNHFTWQGNVRSNRQTIAFRNEFDLLLINRLVREPQAPCRNTFV